MTTEKLQAFIFLVRSTRLEYFSASVSSVQNFGGSAFAARAARLPLHHHHQSDEISVV